MHLWLAWEADWCDEASPPSHSPGSSCQLSFEPVGGVPFELELRQFSLDHAHLTLTVLR